MSVDRPAPMARDLSSPDINPDHRDVITVDDLIDRMKGADTIDDWSKILQDHIKFGNKKLASNVAIFNLGTAHECPNRETDHCQVPWDVCYAGEAERVYPGVYPYRQRQAFLWRSLDPDTFVRAFERILERKRLPVDALRLNEAGDFAVQGDIVRADVIAERLADHGITTYLYTASDYLDWSAAENLTVNASNPHVENADRRYMAVPTAEDIPDGAVHCPHDIDTDVQCGDCRACIDPRAGDVYTVIH